MADDLGYADLSCYGRTHYQTPVLDSMAGEGLQFMHAYSNSAVCTATRVGLITGRYQYRLRLGLEEPGTGGGTLGMPPEHPTLPSLLRDSGYRTILVGKWHMGAPPEFGPLKSGYDDFYGIYGGASFYFRHVAGEDGIGEREALIDHDKPAMERGYLTNLLTDRAIREIGKTAADRKPLFMSLHYTSPHWPWEGPDDEGQSRSVKNMMDQERGSIQKYGEMVRNLDTNIGRVLKALQDNGMADNTIVVFTSDNGGERYSDVWPFVGVKSELLEGGIRVPCIVRWPARVAPGRKTDQVSISMDWFATFLAVAGTKPHPDFPTDGENLLKQLSGAPPVTRKLYWRYDANDQEALRDGEWKYLKIRNFEHLYNVVADQRERADRKNAEPAIFARLKADYQAWNATMLPYPEPSKTHSSHDVTKGNYSDRY
jgi:arylsulfatase A-like enzyme